MISAPRSYLRRLAVLPLVLAVVVPGFAAELTTAQRDSLVDRLASFESAVWANDMTRVMQLLPPKVLEELGRESGLTNDRYFGASQRQLDELLQHLKLESFNVDLEHAQFATLDDGLQYALVPNDSVLDGGKLGRMRSKTSVLAVLEGDAWYFVRVEDSQPFAAIKEVYPAFVDVTFPQGSMEPVTE